MKKQLVLGMFAMFATAGSVMAQEAAAAQGQGMQQKQPNERAKETALKLQNDLSLTTEVAGKLYDPFFQFYTDQQKAMDEMRASGSFDREKMKATRDALTDARDKKLAAILTADQMKKWKDEIEPSMRPQRRQGN